MQLTTEHTKVTETFSEPDPMRDQQPGYGWLTGRFIQPADEQRADFQHNFSVCAVASVVKNSAYLYTLRKMSY
jgi:hypothetical protein